jgi:hypothetical protein
MLWLLIEDFLTQKEEGDVFVTRTVPAASEVVERTSPMAGTDKWYLP